MTGLGVSHDTALANKAQASIPTKHKASIPGSYSLFLQGDTWKSYLLPSLWQFLGEDVLLGASATIL